AQPARRARRTALRGHLTRIGLAVRGALALAPLDLTPLTLAGWPPAVAEAGEREDGPVQQAEGEPDRAAHDSRDQHPDRPVDHGEREGHQRAGDAPQDDGR